MFAEKLWGKSAKWHYLLLAALVALFSFLGARDIWTQEHRWADIVSGMFYRHDFLHPYLAGHTYYDKPLLSYWLIAIAAVMTGKLSVFALRLPSALAGLLAIWSTYRLGLTIKDKALGLLAGWLLLTTYYFLFWARTSSADMLNLAGTMLAISWYYARRHQQSYVDYALFFIIVALTSLCKGLVGAIVPMIAVLTDVILGKSWRQHMTIKLVLAMMPAAILYLAPFVASSVINGEAYGQNGLYLVYKENILRYFQPFDHQGPIYTYFIYLPIYTLPWAIFLLPTLWSLRSRWMSLSYNMKWLCWTFAITFIFFTFSGSRRSYYVLPMVPFALLLIADWCQWREQQMSNKSNWFGTLVVAAYGLVMTATVLGPAYYYQRVGAQQFVRSLQMTAAEIKPWQDWKIVMLDAQTKLDFYLNKPEATKYYYLKNKIGDITALNITRVWPMLTNKSNDTIFISRKKYASLLMPYFPNYQAISSAQQDDEAPIAFIPI